MVGRNSGLVFGFSLGCAFAGCGGSSDGSDGSDGGGRGGTGGTTPNTCPPTLVNYGSGPGILCDEPTGTTCSDAEQFCVCGGETIEGRPWNCVPTNEGCPSTFPDGDACDPNGPETCEFLDDDRMTCTCTSGAWLCAPNPCGNAYPNDGYPCPVEPGTSCRFFIPASPSDPDNAPNITCTCTADQTWSCPPF